MFGLPKTAQITSAGYTPDPSTGASVLYRWEQVETVSLRFYQLHAALRERRRRQAVGRFSDGIVQAAWWRR